MCVTLYREVCVRVTDFLAVCLYGVFETTTVIEREGRLEAWFF